MTASSICFKSVTHTCTDLTLTNHEQYFMKSQALNLTIMRNAFGKGNRKTKFDRDVKTFDCEMFESELSYFLQ